MKINAAIMLNGILLTMIKYTTGASKPTIEDKETRRVTKKNIPHIIKNAAKARGSSASKTPEAVATPLPPLKCRKTGNIWPRIDAAPQHI